MASPKNSRQEPTEISSPAPPDHSAVFGRQLPQLEGASPQQVLEWAIVEFHPRVAISAAGGVEGMVILDMAWQIQPDVRVFTLDTGRLPEQTYTLFQQVRDRYGIEVEWVFPRSEAVEQLVQKHGPNLMYRSVDLRIACCDVRKGEPLSRKLATLDAWITGLRRDQWRTRKHIGKVEFDDAHGGLAKINPLADWDRGRVWQYIRENDVPYHALYDAGYSSIGCAPCTRVTGPGESERAGRWWWEAEADKECGIHSNVGLRGSRSGDRVITVGDEEKRSEQPTYLQAVTRRLPPSGLSE